VTNSEKAIFAKDISDSSFLFIPEDLIDTELKLFEEFSDLCDSLSTDEILLTVSDNFNNLRLSLNLKYSLLNHIHEDMNNDLMLPSIELFIDHVKKHEDRFSKSLSYYDSMIYKQNLSILHLYMANESDQKDAIRNVLKSISYLSKLDNLEKAGDLYSLTNQHKMALSFFIKALDYDNEGLLRKKAEKVYRMVFDSEVSFDQYLEAILEQESLELSSLLTLNKNPKKIKKLNQYSFSKTFYKNGGLLYITEANTNSNYFINSFHDQCERDGIHFFSVVIEKGPDFNIPEKEYLSVFPESYQRDIWNDFKIESLPVLIFIGKKHKDLLRIYSDNRQLPFVTEEFLKQMIF